MAVTNISYITNLAECYQFVSKLRFNELACIDDPSLDPRGALTGAAQDKAIQALNNATALINSYLSKVYNLSKSAGLVDTVTATSPGLVVKHLTAMIALHYLQIPRLDPIEAMDADRVIHNRLVLLQKSDAAQLLPEDQRTDQVLPGDTATMGIAERGSVFDDVPLYWSPQILGDGRQTPRQPP